MPAGAIKCDRPENVGLIPWRWCRGLKYTTKSGPANKIFSLQAGVFIFV
jgi:hypothetical protein